MKPSEEKGLFKLSLYAGFTLAAFYVFKKCVDGAVFSLTNIDTIFKALVRFGAGAFSVLSLPLTAFVLAYILDPLCDFFEGLCRRRLKIKGERRILGTALTYLCILGVLGILGLMGGMYFKRGFKPDLFLSDCLGQLEAMYLSAEEFLIRHNIYGLLRGVLSRLKGEIDLSLKGFGEGFVKNAAGIGGFALNLLLGLVVAFYFLIDKKRLLKGTSEIFSFILPEGIYKRLKKLALDCHSVFSGYIRGQLTDAVIMSALIASFLSLFKIKFAVTIGIISGFSNIIPYFGAIVGLSLGVASALLGGEPVKAIYAAAVMIGLQQLDSAVIVPKIVGEKVELSPPAVIIALSVGGKLFGIWGMVFAVPVCGILKNIIKGEIAKKRIMSD